MQQISLDQMIFTTILSLVLTGCTSLATSQVPAPSPERAGMVVEQKQRDGVDILNNDQNGITLANDIVTYALDKITVEDN